MPINGFRNNKSDDLQQHLMMQVLKVPRVMFTAKKMSCCHAVLTENAACNEFGVAVR